MFMAFCRSALLLAAALHTATAQEPEKKTPMEERKEEALSGSISGTKKAVAVARIAPKTEEAPPDTIYPREYRYLVAEAMKSFQARDYRGAIVFTDRADAIFPPTCYTINIRGAVAIEQRRFDEGRDLCLRALKLQPGFFPARFNLCEVPFIQGDYKLARSGFMVLYNETAKDDPTIELLTYRIFLTYLLEADTVHAQDWLEKIPFPSQTAAYQYAHAAWERKHGRMTQWHEWLQSAEFIWPEIKRANFVDVLVHLGWLKDSLAPNDPAE